jgi:hypothetical protein
MSDNNCKKCGNRIFWHKSKSGKPYPCDSQDRRDFHQCQQLKPSPAPATVPPPKDLISRVAALESAVVNLLARVEAMGAIPY